MRGGVRRRAKCRPALVVGPHPKEIGDARAGVLLARAVHEPQDIGMKGLLLAEARKGGGK